MPVYIVDILVAAVASLIGSAVLFAAAAIVRPSLAVALFAQPTLLFILSVYVAVPLAYGTLIGALGGIAGRWSRPRANQLVSAYQE